MPETVGGNVIRRARSEDAQQVVRLMNTIYREGRYFVGDGPPLALTLARHIADDDPDSAFYVVAEVGVEGAVAGWLELHRLQPRRMRHVAVLTVAVLPDWRRQGVGRGLLRRGYGWAQDVGVAKISLNVRAGNTGAVALYRAEGFVEEGRERHQVRTDDGTFEDNLIMARWT